MMQETPPLNPSDDGFTIHSAGVLILLAEAVYGDSDTSNPSHAKLKTCIGMFLKAARDGGFAQCDILETLLARRDFSVRLGGMAVAACDAAGSEAIDKIFEFLRKKGVTP